MTGQRYIVRERCSAATETGRQCRKTKNLTRTLITIHRESDFFAQLPEHAVVNLCPSHLQRLLATRKPADAPGKEKAE